MNWTTLFLLFVFFTPASFATTTSNLSPEISSFGYELRGNDEITVNGAVHPHGLPTSYFIEYGSTRALEKKTDVVVLPPKLLAHYHEGFNNDKSHWFRGLTGRQVEKRPNGVSEFAALFDFPSYLDHNHLQGVGEVLLSAYFYTGSTHPGSLHLGENGADLRDAKLKFYLRGHNWNPRASNLVWWIQSQSNPEKINTPGWRRANWAYTGASLNPLLKSQKWEEAELTLVNDSRWWTYASNTFTQPGKERYSYWPLDKALGSVNANMILSVIGVEPSTMPENAFTFDEFQLSYHNYSLLIPSNGGKMIEWPTGSKSKPDVIVDGWRTGAEHLWLSEKNPDEPQTFTFRFKNPVEINTLYFHQHPEWPTKDFEVLGSNDGKNYNFLFRGALTRPLGINANFDFSIFKNLTMKVSYLKVRLLSGYKTEQWGLANLEAFGTGAEFETEDNWNHINADLVGLTPGKSFYYRIVAKNNQGVSRYGIQQGHMPETKTPSVLLTAPLEVGADRAVVSGMVNPMGLMTENILEYGPDEKYGTTKLLSKPGEQQTYRALTQEITGLTPGQTYHYRICARNENGKSCGNGATFTTRGPPLTSIVEASLGRLRSFFKLR